VPLRRIAHLGHPFDPPGAISRNLSYDNHRHVFILSR
jgi:hypothetical protein